MRATVIVLFSIFSLFQFSLAQNGLEEVKGRMGIYHVNFPQEKVYVHTDKSQYVLGEKIWLKAYLVSSTLHTPITPSQQVIVELIDPNNVILSTITVHIKDGGAAGDFTLGTNWETGKYLLRAYTNYQRNFSEPFFFEKEIMLYNAYLPDTGENIGDDQALISDNGNDALNQLTPDLQLLFFPEGGDMVAGIPVKVAINALDSKFRGKGLEGLIRDDSGVIISRFRTHESGLGFFKMIPVFGTKYEALVTWKGQELEFALPEVLNEGYTMAITESLDTLTVLVNSSTSTGLNGTFIIGHIRGQLVSIVQGLNGPRGVIKIPLTNTPDGITHYTLFTENGIPVSERLVFILRDENSHKIEFSTPGDSFGRLDEISINLKNGELSPESILNGSLAVTELGIGTPRKYASDIRTYLLIESDLKGLIPDPGYFFEEGSISRGLLDNLMLTHGWRRFEWKKILEDPTIDVTWPPENSLSLKGYITKYGNVKNRVKSRVFLTTLTDDFNMMEQITNENGEFEFSDFVNSDTIPLLIQAEIYKENEDEEKRNKKILKKGSGPIGNRYVDIFIENSQSPLIERDNSPIEFLQDTTGLFDYFETSKKTFVIDSAYNDILTYSLEEVVIEADKIDPVVGDRILVYSEPDRRIVIDSLAVGTAGRYRNVFELIRGRFPGVTVVGAFPTYNAILRGANSIQGDIYATFVLDGTVVDVTLINFLPVNRVAFIDVLSSLSKASIYGSSGNGVIAIYTKRGREMIAKEKVGSMNYTFPGYYKPEVFYSPDYGKIKNSIKPDYRTTLYWNPDIKVASNKLKKLSFYSSEKASLYSIRFEGITSDGHPVVFRKMVEVK